jgi:hypothetical protein
MCCWTDPARCRPPIRPSCAAGSSASAGISENK